MRITTILAILVLLAACAPQVVPNSLEACAVQPVTEVPLIPPSPTATTRWAIAMALDGKPVTMMLDSGATGLVISTEAAARLGLRLRPDVQATSSGLGGTVYRRVFEVDSITIGSQTETKAQFAIEMTAAQEAGRGFDGIVGMRPLDQNDIEIDFPARTLRLYRARFCPAGAPPWPGRVDTFPRSRSGQHSRWTLPMVAVTLDGRQAHALLDTGASSSVVDLGFAPTVGAPATAPAGARLGSARTMSELTMPMWQHRFGSAEIAGRRFSNPHFWILDLGMVGDMIVGLDVLAQLRIWISTGSDTAYIR